jgi:hypothetical protein
VEQQFLPWMMDSAFQELNKAVVVRRILDGMLREVSTTRHEQTIWLEEQYRMIAEAHETTLNPPEPQESYLWFLPEPEDEVSWF